MTLLELAERCEQSEGPDRKLDALITKHFRLSSNLCSPFGYQGLPFTSSLDTAMTLLPEGQTIPVLNSAINACWRETHLHGQKADELFHQHFPAFVCAAALRARASQETQPAQGEQS